MSSDDYSGLQKIRKTVHVALPMCYVANPLAGVINVLDSWKYQYVQILDGVVLSFEEISFVNPLGRILADQPFVHYDINAQFTVFKPSVGSILQGVINRISKQHAGCLVHDNINVCINLTGNSLTDIDNFVFLSNKVLFYVTHVEIHRKTIRVKGQFTPECIELMRAQGWTFVGSRHTYFEEGLPVDGEIVKQSTEIEVESFGEISIKKEIIENGTLQGESSSETFVSKKVVEKSRKRKRVNESAEVSSKKQKSSKSFKINEQDKSITPQSLQKEGDNYIKLKSKDTSKKSKTRKDKSKKLKTKKKKDKSKKKSEDGKQRDKSSKKNKDKSNKNRTKKSKKTETFTNVSTTNSNSSNFPVEHVKIKQEII